MALLRSCVVAILVALIAVSGSSADNSLDGYELIEITPQTEKQVAFLRQVERTHNDIDFWQHPNVNMTSLVMVPPQRVADFQTVLKQQNIPFVVVSTSIKSMVEATYPKKDLVSLSQRFSLPDAFHREYHDWDEIKEFLTRMALQYKSMVDVNYFGEPTYEKKRLMVVKLTSPDSQVAKPTIVVEAGIHAREWVSPAANLYVIEKLLQGYHAGDSDAQSMLDKFDWYFVPVTNPDGYAYTHTPNNYMARMWRKNRRLFDTFDQRSCIGIDLNRNFDVEHGTVGISFDCHSDIYPGEIPFSEAESRSIRALVKSVEKDLVAYLAVHSYSQYILVPWSYSYTSERPTGYMEHDRVAKLMSEAIRKEHGKIFRVGTAFDLLRYAASGGSFDWAMAEYKDIYSYAYELRPDPRDRYGFLLPQDQIIPAGEEYLASLVAMTKAMKVGPAKS